MGFRSGTARAERQPELALLFLTARTRLDAGEAAELERLVRRAVDWEYLIPLARKHGTLPLLCWHMETVSPDALPDGIRNELRSHLRESAHTALYRTQELLQILSHLYSHGVGAVPYKGPVLGAFLYGNLALRPHVDLDLLVRRSDVLKAKDLLHTIGYEPVHPLTPRHWTALVRFRRVLDFSRRESPSIVELHWSIVPEYFSSSYGGDDLWGRMMRRELGGRRVTTFSPEDCLLVLCLHGAKHLWFRLIWICDVAELIRTHPEGRWGEVLERARAIGCERMVLLGIHLAHDLLGAPLSEELAREIETRSALQKLSKKVTALLVREAPTLPGGWESTAFFLRVRETIGRRAADIVRVFLAPSPEDWAALPLPFPLWPAYALTRPVRLLRKYGLGKRNSRPPGTAS